MTNAEIAVSLLLAASLSACTGMRRETEAASSPTVGYLARTHSHNDYDRGRPLLDAVERGFASVEVDVFLVEGELYVAHDEEDVQPSEKMTRLYLDPLRELVLLRGGWVYAPSDPPLQLLIDVKTPAEETYRVLDETLAAYGDILTSWTRAGITAGPVTAVLSGNRAFDLVFSDTLRYVALDGRVDEERSRWSTVAMPLVSMDWETLRASATEERLVEARELVERVHREGRKVRFWGTPDRERVWASLIAIGVDYIGTDDAGRLQRMLRGR
jgi:glycerophosphoryl diester phosphodiesterase